MLIQWWDYVAATVRSGLSKSLSYLPRANGYISNTSEESYITLNSKEKKSISSSIHIVVNDSFNDVLKIRYFSKEITKRFGLKDNDYSS